MMAWRKACIWAALVAAIAVGAGCDDDDDGDGVGGTGGAGGTGGEGGAGGEGGEGGEGGGGGEGGLSCEVDTSYDPVIDPANFASPVENTFFPLVPGTVFTYEQAPDVVVTVEVTSETKEILGVTTIVVHDVETEGGEVIEDTFDWFATDNEGTVWYFGEDTTEFEDGVPVSTEGSWEAGVDGAKPGIIMPGDPTVGQTYRQEYYVCVAEDEGEILSIDEAVTVAGTDYTGCVQTRDFTRLEPDVEENKYYCPGVGLVLAVDLETGDREELVQKTDP